MIRAGTALWIFEMKLKKLNNKGVAYVWMTVIVVLFVIGLLYLTLDDIVENSLKAAATDTGSSLPPFLTTAWDAIPIFIVFGLFVFGIARSQKEYGYQ